MVEGFPALGASEGFLPSVDSLMDRKVRFAGESLLALVTLVGLLARVQRLVPDERGWVFEPFLAPGALVDFFPCM